MSECGEFRIPVHLAATGEQLCTVRLQSSDTFSDVHSAVADVTGHGCCFDLLLGGRLLPCDSQLAAVGLSEGCVVQLVRRQLVAADISLTKYSEGSLGCLRLSYRPGSGSGAELRLVGLRFGYGDFMSFEWYSDPCALQDSEGGVFAHYRKVVRDVGEDVRTRHVAVRRPLRLRSDLVVAHQADGGRWVPLHRADAPQAERRAPEGLPVAGDVPDGRRLELLGSAGEWLRVRCPTHGEAWVRRGDVQRLGEVSLDWAGPEEVLSETVLE